MTVTDSAPFPLPLEQAGKLALQSKDKEARIIAIRSLRYHVGKASSAAHRRTNTIVLDIYGRIAQRSLRRFEAAVAAGYPPKAVADAVRNDPILRVTGETLQRILSRPTLHGGCYDHKHAWRLDFLGLEGSILSRAVLRGASLRHCDLTKANLEHADLSGADLSDANLSGARLAHADLSGAVLSGASLAWADLNHARLDNAFINQSDLTGAVLDHASMRRALLSATDMSKASLTETDLTDTNLFAARLARTTLQNTILTGTGITVERIRRLAIAVRSNPETRWGTEADRDGMNPLALHYYTEESAV